MKFVKMEGLANDFILIGDAAEENINALQKNVPAWCDRRRGIGADGVILVLPSAKADFRMRIFNADASEAEMCGNGIRCFAVYLKKKGLWDKSLLNVETIAGTITTERIGDAIKVNMGAPILDAPRIPFAKENGRAIMERIAVDGAYFSITAVSMGNPHAVIYADELTDELVTNIGKKIESHPFFPQRVNVEFVKVLSDKEIQMRVFERGCGETPACGTGACAAVVSGVLNKKHGNAVIVHLLGGDLFVEWDGNSLHPVHLTGPARWVFQGEM
jgi:diaminopimelate epimerase